jgi:methanogenic corrinoid protein MtbC1
MESHTVHDSHSNGDAATELLADLTARIDALDRHGAVELALGSVTTGSIGVADLYTQVLGPLLGRVGSSWQHGTERVWQEHFASHTVRTIVEALYPTVIRESAAVDRVGTTALLACPPREEHELGLRMLADRFELAGWDVIYLGANTPVGEIVAAAAATDSSLVALSVSTLMERVELRCFVDELHSALPDRRIVIGGPAIKATDGVWTDDELLDPTALGLPGVPRAG